MATTFRDALATTSASGTSFSVTRPSGTVQNDLQLAFLVCDANGNAPVISGGATWSQIGSNANISNGDTATFALYAQVAGGSEPATYTVDKVGAQDAVAAIVVYSGVDVSGGVAGAVAAQLATNPNSASPPASPVSIAADAITTTADNQTVVWFGMVDWNSASAASFTDPSSTNRRLASTPALFSNALIVDFVKASTGSTGTITGTGTLASATGNFGAWMVALVDGGGSPPAAARIITPIVSVQMR